MAQGTLEHLVSTMTIAELAQRSGRSIGDIVAFALDARAGSPRAARPRPEASAPRPRRAKANGVNTRTPAGRAAYEAAVFGVVEAASGVVSANEIRGKVGGTPLQARAALNRLIEAGKVKFQGKARGTRYST